MLVYVFIADIFLIPVAVPRGLTGVTAMSFGSHRRVVATVIYVPVTAVSLVPHSRVISMPFITGAAVVVSVATRFSSSVIAGVRLNVVPGILRLQ